MKTGSILILLGMLFWPGWDIFADEPVQKEVVTPHREVPRLAYTVTLTIQQPIKNADEAALRGSRAIAEGNIHGAISEYLQALHILPAAPATEQRHKAYTKQLERARRLLRESGGWDEKFPRPEIAPVFTQTDNGDLILSSKKSGTNGHFLAVFPVEGGKSYLFSALRTAENIESERRSCVVRIEWYGPGGKAVQSPYKMNPAYFGKETDKARPDFPQDREKGKDGSVLVEGTYLAPQESVEAHVQLHLRWTDAGKVTWRNVAFAQSEPVQPRLVKLAAVHHNLNGEGKNTVAGNREKLAPFVEEAAKQGADLIVLGEYITCKNVTGDYGEVAEQLPGPTSAFFGSLAKKHDCYIVFSIPERSGHEIFNAAVMVGPDGAIVGKYRKVTLPREEIQHGISPGTEYPVFETRFGKVGMMVCYDVFFPEVARELSLNGAEIIALPIWGGNPRLAAARCAENGVFLVTSTYTNHESNWMKTAIWDREGNRISEANEWGTIVIAEVDLNKPTYWQFLGDFKSRIKREGPVRKAEKDHTSKPKN